MIQKVVHLGDLHIRLYRRFDEYRSVLNKFFEQQRILKPDRIVVAGDIVHSKNTVSPEMIEMVCWFFTECAKITKTIIIPGNHDFLGNNADRLDTLSPIIQALNNPNLIYLKRSECYEDENVIWCVWSQLDNNVSPNILPYKQKYGKDKKYIGLFHGAILGSKTPMGFEFEDGFDVAEFHGVDCVMAGDIHLKQKLMYENVPIVYCGSLIQQNFGELPEGHGYLVWDIDTIQYEEYDIENEYGFYTFRVGYNEVNDIMQEVSKNEDLYRQNMNGVTTTKTEYDIQKKFEHDYYEYLKAGIIKDVKITGSTSTIILINDEAMVYQINGDEIVSKVQKELQKVKFIEND